MKSKYQDALNSLNPNYIGEQEYSWRKATELLQELVDKETKVRLERRIMFTKEKLEKWIEALNYINRVCWTNTQSIEHVEELKSLKKTLEQIYTSITSDGSI